MSMTEALSGEDDGPYDRILRILFVYRAVQEKIYKQGRVLLRGFDKVCTRPCAPQAVSHAKLQLLAVGETADALVVRINFAFINVSEQVLHCASIS